MTFFFDSFFFFSICWLFFCLVWNSPYWRFECSLSFEFSIIPIPHVLHNACTSLTSSPPLQSLSWLRSWGCPIILSCELAWWRVAWKSRWLMPLHGLHEVLGSVTCSADFAFFWICMHCGRCRLSPYRGKTQSPSQLPLASAFLAAICDPTQVQTQVYLCVVEVLTPVGCMEHNNSQRSQIPWAFRDYPSAIFNSNAWCGSL